MASGGQGSNPWAGAAPRGAGGGAFGNQQPYGGFPTNPYNANPWTNTGPRGAGGGPFGGGYRPGGPSVTMPGSVDPRFMNGSGGLETGGTSPVPTQPNPTLNKPMMSGGGFMTRESDILQPGAMQPAGTPNPGSMNQSFSGVGQQFTGQGGPGSFYGQYGQMPGGMTSGGFAEGGGNRNGMTGMSGGPSSESGALVNGSSPIGSRQFMPNQGAGAWMQGPNTSPFGDGGMSSGGNAGNFGNPTGMTGISGGPSSFGGQPVNGSSPGGGVAMPSQPAYSGEYFKPGQTLTVDQLPAWNKWREAGMPSAPSAAAGGAGAPPTNIYGGPGSGAPYDPTTPGYQPGAGWQTMLRQYAMRDGQSNPNQYIQDRGLNPMWGGQQQPWEPQGFAGGLSQLLQRYRGF